MQRCKLQDEKMGKLCNKGQTQTMAKVLQMKIKFSIRRMGTMRTSNESTFHSLGGRRVKIVNKMKGEEFGKSNEDIASFVAQEVCKMGSTQMIMNHYRR